MIDEDGHPLPARPWEPPGPQPKSKLTDAGRRIIFGAVVAAGVMALLILVFMPSIYGVSPG